MTGMTTAPVLDASGTTRQAIAAQASDGSIAPAHVNVDNNGAFIAVALDGTDATGITAPTGGVGIRGWLSGIYNRLAGVVLAAGTAVIGKISVQISSADVSSSNPFFVQSAKNAQSVTASASLASNNDAATISCDGMNTVIAQLASGGWSGGPVVFEASADGGATYSSVTLAPYAGGAGVSSSAAGGLWEMACGGLTHFRVRASANITSGPVAAVVRATNGLKSLRVGAPSTNPVPVSAGHPSATGSVALTTSGTVYSLFSGATPANGFSVYNADGNVGLWISDVTATPTAGGQDCWYIPPLTGYDTPTWYKPVGPVYALAGTANHKIAAKSG